MSVNREPMANYQTRANIIQGPFLTAKYFLPNLENSENGRIVNISSAFGSVTGKLARNHSLGFLTKLTLTTVSISVLMLITITQTTRSELAWLIVWPKLH